MAFQMSAREAIIRTIELSKFDKNTDQPIHDIDPQTLLTPSFIRTELYSISFYCQFSETILKTTSRWQKRKF